MNNKIRIVENVKDFMEKTYTNLRYSISENKFAVIFKKNDLGYISTDSRKSITITYEPFIINIGGYDVKLVENMEVNKKNIDDEMFFYDI